MVIHATHPFEALLNLQKALANLDNRESWFNAGTSERGTFPPINLFQEGDNFVMITELPGITRSDVNVEIHQNRVRVSGEKKINYGENVSIHRAERQSGIFDRTFTVPFEINADNVRAEYRDGILALYLPRAEHEKPRSVKVA